MEPGGSAPEGGDWLLERWPELAALERSAADVQSSPAGRLVLVSGEPGVGKTALVRALCAARDGTRVLWGACDALLTPRPLAPVTGPAVLVGEDGGPPCVVRPAQARRPDPEAGR